jgi:hypothetical protein
MQYTYTYSEFPFNLETIFVSGSFAILWRLLISWCKDVFNNSVLTLVICEIYVSALTLILDIFNFYNSSKINFISVFKWTNVALLIALNIYGS